MVKQRNTRKLLSVLVSLAMIATLFSGLGITASAADYTMTAVWNSGTPNVPASGDTVSIANATEMGFFQQYVNGDYATAQITFYLTQNIALTGTWTPVGNADIESASTSSPQVEDGNGFAGNFNGGGYTISGLYVTASQNGSGLFRYLAPAGTISSLAVSGTVNVSGGVDAVGGVVGYNSGTITNVVSSVTVTATSAYNVGGIAGFNNGYYKYDDDIPAPVGMIANSVNVGAVTGGSKIGGITGENSGTIVSCYNTGAVNSSQSSGNIGVGGITGRNGNNNSPVESGFIANCYNTGAIGNADHSWIGGITGFNNGTSYIFNCYNVGTVYDGYNYHNPIVGRQEGYTSLCYALPDSTATGNTPAEIGAVMTQAQMQDTSFSDTLNANVAASSGIWTQTSGNYPDLARSVLPSAYTIAMTTAPSTLSYVAGDMFDTDGMVLTVTLTGSGTSFTTSSFALTAPGPLTTSNTTETVYTVAANTVFTTSFGITVAGQANTPITAGGTYYLSNYVNGTLQIQTTAPVTLIGQGTTSASPSQNINISYTVSGANLTLSDVYLSMTVDSAIAFTGTGNTLTLASENIINSSADYSAAILVPAGGALTIAGDGTLYMNKSSLAAGIGGDYGAANGAITVNSGSLFIRGSRTGAAIGTGGVGAPDPNNPVISGNITFNGGSHNVATASQGAAIGGGFGAQCGYVYLNAGSLNVVSDFSGAAIGSGNSTGSFGTLYIGNALLAVSGTGNRPGNAPPLITANILSSSGGSTYVQTMTVPAAAISGTLVFQIDGADGYVGKFNNYSYSANNTYTPSIWTVNATLSSVTFYLAGGADHLVNIGGAFSKATWDAINSEFNISSAPTVTINTGASLSTALSGLTGVQIIEIDGTPATGTTNIALTNQQVIIRGSSFTGNLFAVDSGDSLTVTSGIIDGNAVNATGVTGSLIYVSGGTLAINGGALQNNTTTGNGGAINISGGSVAMSDGTITGNSADSSGGLHLTGGSTTLSGGVISGNTASGNGGGVGVFGQFTLNGTEISGNTSGANGGGLYINNSNILNLTSGTISGNGAVNGGGIYVDSNTATLGGITIADNTASANGGGVYVPSGVTVTITDAIINNNTAASNGNGIYDDGALTLTPTTGFNIADVVYLTEDTTITLNGVLGSTITVQCETAEGGVQVALCDSPGDAASNTAFFQYVDGSFAFGSDDNYIILAETR
jgi:hypothetical protein